MKAEGYGVVQPDVLVGVEMRDARGSVQFDRPVRSVCVRGVLVLPRG